MPLLRETTALCRTCHTSHPAEVVIRDRKVIGITHCPHHDDEVELSSNANLYLQLTRQSTTPVSEPAPSGLKYVLNYLSITNACNFYCTVCGTDAGGPKHTFLSTEEICARAQEARNQGAHILHLFGGEPTLHPDLQTLIRRLTDMGLSVGLVTNGFLMGRKPDLALSLKQCGLKRVCLQFDSLNRESLDVLSRDFLVEKKKAIQHALEAGLQLGLNCTVTQRTLPELGTLIEHGISLGTAVRNMTFGCVAPVGRYLISQADTVDREEIVAALTETGEAKYFALNDVLPLPAYVPWGMQIHPDCGVHILLIRHPGGATALNRFVNLRKLYEKLATCRQKPSFFSSRVLPGWYALQSIRLRTLPRLLALATGMLLRKNRYGLMNIGISDYRAAAFLDEQRLCRCASAFHTSVGPVRGCLHFYQRADIPGSLAYEATHQSC